MFDVAKLQAPFVLHRRHTIEERNTRNETLKTTDIRIGFCSDLFRKQGLTPLLIQKEKNLTKTESYATRCTPLLTTGEPHAQLWKC
jgi:hypothetical protein